MAEINGGASDPARRRRRPTLRKLLATLTSLLLVGSFSTPAQSAGTTYMVNQKTLATFNGSSTTLSYQQKAQVRATVEANPFAEKFICTGIRYYSQPMSVNIMVRKRAKEACAYAKQLNPNLSTWYQNKPTKARSYAGKVLLTVKSPVTDSPSSAEACKVVDGQSAAARSAFEGTQVNGKRARGNIGFPISPTTIPTTGEAKMIAAMVAFQDAPPSKLTPSGYLTEQVQKIEDWSTFWSQGKFQYDFKVVPNWIVLPVDQADYPVNSRVDRVRSQENSNKIIRMIIERLPTNWDYSDVDGVMVYWSPGISAIESDVGLQGIEGIKQPFPGISKEVFFWAGHYGHYQDNGRLTAKVFEEYNWSNWIYLMLDSQGLHNHGPGNGWGVSPQSKQQSAADYSSAPYGWDEFRLGWTEDAQIHCVTPLDLDNGPSEFFLNARELYGGERRLAVVPLEGQGAIVVEARRPIGPSKWTKEKSGLLVYFVDTELDVERVDSFTQGGCGTSESQPKWAYFLYADDFAGDCREFSSVFIREGDTVTHGEIRITNFKSASTVDYVRIEKVK